MSGRRVSEAQLEALDIIGPGELPTSWGDVWTQMGSNFGDKYVALAFRNFDRTAKALVRHGWVNDDDGSVVLTAAGRAALKETTHE